MLKYIFIIIVAILGICLNQYLPLKAYISKLPVNDNFNGKNFINSPVDGAIKKNSTLFTFLKWRFSGEKRPEWPEAINFTQRDLITRKNSNEIIATFINHSTILIQTPYGNIITDPVFSKRVGPFNLVGPKRVHQPGIALENLPHIDYVLISHDHYDHMDLSSLNHIYQRDNSKIYGGLGLSAYDKKLHIQEMDWWQTKIINQHIKLHFVPAKHWSGRYGFFGNNKTLWGGFLIEINNKMIYFAGDTGFTKHFLEIASRYPGQIIMSFLPIGAYEPRWFMQASHINPEESVKAHLILGSQKSIAIHHGTFRLSNEAYDQPIMDLKKSIKKYGLSDDAFQVLQPGQSIILDKF